MMTVWFLALYSASRDSVVGLHGDEVKVAITARRLTAANSHLVKFLGKQFRVAKAVVIEKGELGRHKQIKIINPQQIPPEIAALIN